MPENLYPWQEKCLNSWMKNNGRGIVQAVTGSGKTFLALTAASRLDERMDYNLRIKIVVPTGALMRQWKRALQEILSVSDSENLQKIGLRGDGFHMDPDYKYMIYVINSARYELARQIISDLQSGAPVLLIADECHRYESSQNRLIFEFLPHIEEYRERFFSLGLTATLPNGASLDYLVSVLGKVIYNYSISQASASRHISQYDIFHIELSFSPAERAEYEELTDRMKTLYSSLVKADPSLKSMSAGERFEQLRILAGSQNRKIAESASAYMALSYKRKGVVCLANARISCACSLIHRLPSKEKILIFGERIDQAERLYALLSRQYPEKVGRFHSRMGQRARQNALNRFRTGEIRILVTCRSLDEGIDIPDASIGIILSGTSVQRQRIQRLGRIIRKAEGKEKASLYYFHISESTEDDSFLPDSGRGQIHELKYSCETGEFTDPIYDNAASALLDAMRHKKIDPEKLTEIKRCLNLGVVRPDWLAESSQIEAHIQKAKHVEDKNYWICMKWMSAQRDC